MSRRRKALALTLSIALAGAVLVATPLAAQAATGNIRTPFEPGGQVYVYQGYSSGTHTSKSQYGLDLTTGTSATSTSGRTVVAPQSGTVSYWQSAYGNLCINVSGNRSYTLTHINATVTSRGATITAGQKVGTVQSPNASNNNVAHLHFQYWSQPNCYNSSPIPFSSANSLRICGAPDMPATGPSAARNGVWSGTVFTASNCTVTKAFTAAPTPTLSAVNLGARLNSSVGTWSPTPTTLTRQWLRNGSAIGGQTGSAYTLTGSDYLRVVSVRVTASRSGYTTTSRESRRWFVAKVTSAGGSAYVNVRQSATASSAYLGRIYSGALVGLDCYVIGAAVKGPYGTSSIWYRISGIGWVSDALLETGSNSAVTRSC